MARLFVGLLAGLLAVGNPADAGELRWGGKLLLTGGVGSLDGAAGGGLATWATIAGDETRDGIGGAAHATLVTLPDFEVRAAGAAVGFYDRVELSYAHQSVDTGAVGAALGLGRGFTFDQDVYGAKVRIAGDLVYDGWLPQIAVGAQHRRSRDGAIVRAVGAAHASDTDFYVAATKLLLGQSLVINATARLTRANQIGTLGFGTAGDDKRRLAVELSAGRLITSRLLIGAEYRSKPDRLAIAREDDWWDVFAAWAVTRNLSLTAAYVDLGSIATFGGQRGAYLSARASF